MHDPFQRPSLLSVSLVPESPCLFLNLAGELDLCSIEEVPREDFSWRQDLTTVLVDLGELSFCDATGIRALVDFARIHEAQGRAVSVVRASPFIWRLMRLCGISDRLSLSPPTSTTAV